MDNKKKYQTTEEHYAQYVAYCKEYINLFGLQDWSVKFEHKNFDDDHHAECEHSTGDQNIAWLRLSNVWFCEPTEKELRETALHEVCHLMLANLDNIACWDDLSANQTRSAYARETHAVINRLVSAYLGKK